VGQPRVKLPPRHAILNRVLTPFSNKGLDSLGNQTAYPCSIKMARSTLLLCSRTSPSTTWGAGSPRPIALSAPRTRCVDYTAETTLKAVLAPKDRSPVPDRDNRTIHQHFGPKRWSVAYEPRSRCRSRISRPRGADELADDRPRPPNWLALSSGVGRDTGFHSYRDLPLCFTVGCARSLSRQLKPRLPLGRRG